MGPTRGLGVSPQSAAATNAISQSMGSRPPTARAFQAGGGQNVATPALQRSFGTAPAQTAAPQTQTATAPAQNTFPAYNPDLPENQRQAGNLPVVSGPIFNAPWQQSERDAAGNLIPYPEQAPGFAEAPGAITVQPQAADATGKTHDYTAAPVAPDTSVPITGGGVSNKFMFTPTGGPVSGLGRALRVPTSYGGGTPFESGYDLPAGYREAVAQGPAAAVDFLQSGPRGADGLTDAQRHLVR